MRAKYRVIEHFKSKYPIQKMCEIFEVSRSGFYKWRKKIQQPVQHSELDQIIIACQAQTNQTCGYRRVLRWMQRNHTRLLQCMGHADTRMVETVYARTSNEGVMKQLETVEAIN